MTRSLGVYLLAATVAAATGCAARPAAKAFRMGMMPKITGIAYFNACEKGAKEAAAELGIDLVWDGPDKDDVREQIRMLDQWITEGYDCIAVAANHPKQIADVLERARAKGIAVLTFDADADGGRAARSIAGRLLTRTHLQLLVAEKAACHRPSRPSRPGRRTPRFRPFILRAVGRKMEAREGSGTV